MTDETEASDEPQPQVALEIARGVIRLFAAHGAAAIPELPLPNGRRADIVSLWPDGTIWIVEIKSCEADFRTDQKWPEYRGYCDRLLFAVARDFPVEILPPDQGLILADRFGGAIVREASEVRLAAARRKVITMRFARAAALRLAAVSDPGFALAEL